jgi:hypothetical protein
MANVINRPTDKRVVDFENKRIILEWDNFFYLMSKAVNNIQNSSSFTLSAASSTVVSDTRITSASFVGMTPSNAAALDLQRSSQGLYVDTAETVPGVSFTVKTADGTSAGGTETFLYNIIG